jgi:hypothetical protein
VDHLLAWADDRATGQLGFGGFLLCAFCGRLKVGDVAIDCNVLGLLQGQATVSAALSNSSCNSAAVHLLAGAPVAHALEIGELDLELLDGQSQRLELHVALRHILGQGSMVCSSISELMGVTLPVEMPYAQQRSFTVNRKRSDFCSASERLHCKRRLRGANRHSPVNSFKQHGQLRWRQNHRTARPAAR